MNDQEDKPMAESHFRVMSFLMAVGQLFIDGRKRLQTSRVAEGQTVLDFACGPGYWAIPTAEIVGEGGKVYALDIHPLAIEAVEKKARKKSLANITTILSGRDTGLPNESIDVILLYDAINMIKNKSALLEELHRVVKPKGVLSIYVGRHSVSGDNVLELTRRNGPFSLKERHGRLLNFEKA
jgi:ubiquinone/menaquinone biosynthesis C-methylase UbiE